jgi:hypothetical protein
LRLLDHPGVYYDEALHVPSAFQLVYADFKDVARAYIVIPLHWRSVDYLPVMILPYLGALKSYVLAISFALLGNTVLALRLPGILMGVFSTVFMFHYARRMWGDLVALLACALIATDATWIFFNRVDWGPMAIAGLLRTLTLCLIFEPNLSERQRNWTMGLAGVAMGLGLWDKANFMWFINALLGFGVLYYICFRQKRLLKSQILFACIGFLLGSAPFWLYNLTNDWKTFSMLSSGGILIRVQMRSLQDVARVAYGRLQGLFLILDGEGFDALAFGEQVPSFFGQRGSFGSQLFIFSFCLLLGLAARPRLDAGARWRLLFLPIVTILMVVQMFITPLTVSMHHLVYLYPFPHLIMAVALIEICGLLRQKARIFISGLVAVVVAVALISNLYVLSQYERFLAGVGGRGYFSDAITALSYVLQTEYSDRSIHIMHWGAANQLSLLSRGQLVLDEPFWEHSEVPPDDYMRELVKDANSIFVLYTYMPQARSAPNAQDTFWLAAELEDMIVADEREIRDRTGAVYSIIELAPASSTAAEGTSP